MTTEQRKKAFEEAKKKRQQQRANQSFGFSGGQQYEDITYTALESDALKCVRLLGNPTVVRENSWDPKTFLISMIRGDNGKQFRCIWPSKEDQADWILWRVFDKVMKYDYDRTRNQKNYHYAESHPEIFNRVHKNSKPDNTLEKGWKPQTMVAFNVIDRHDMQWHRDNQHTKVLSKKVSESGDSLFFDPGIPMYLYETIWDSVVEFSGDWNLYDVIVQKISKEPFYRAYHPEDDHKKVMQINPDILDLAEVGPLSEEESNFEKYDFDKIYPVTSYTKIKNRLGKFLKEVDGAFGTKFFDEVEYQAQKEDEKRKEQAQEENSRSITKEKETPTQEPETKEEPPKKARRRPAQKEESTPEPGGDSHEQWLQSLADGTYNGTRYEGIPYLTEKEKAMIEGIDDETGQLQYMEEFEGEKVVLMENPSNGMLSPESFSRCPLSNEVFED